MKLRLPVFLTLAVGGALLSAPALATPEPAVLTGHVTTADGTPIAGTVVSAYSRLVVGDSVYWVLDPAPATTAADGSYRIDADPGTFRLSFLVPDNSYAAAYDGGAADLDSATDVVVGAGETATVDARLTPNALVSGVVRAAADGSTVAGVHLRLYRSLSAGSGMTQVADTTSADDGGYRLYAPAGSYSVCPDQTAVYAWQCDAGVVLPGVHDVALTRRPAVQGVLADLGTAVSGATVNVYQLSFVDDQTWERVAQGATDESGRFFVAVDPGTYRVGYVSADGGAERYYAGAYAAVDALADASDIVVVPHGPSDDVDLGTPAPPVDPTPVDPPATTAPPATEEPPATTPPVTSTPPSHVEPHPKPVPPAKAYPHKPAPKPVKAQPSPWHWVAGWFAPVRHPAVLGWNALCWLGGLGWR